MTTVEWDFSFVEWYRAGAECGDVPVDTGGVSDGA